MMRDETGTESAVKGEMAMNGLISELKREHEAIEDMLTRATDTSITNREVHQILIAAKEGLIMHLQKEDERLYPVLKKVAAVDPLLRQTLELYAKGMKVITGDAIAFFEKYSGEESAIDIEFAKAASHLFWSITRRMRNEEKTLFPAYQKMFH